MNSDPLHHGTARLAPKSLVGVGIPDFFTPERSGLLVMAQHFRQLGCIGEIGLHAIDPLVHPIFGFTRCPLPSTIPPDLNHIS
ncbi:MAG: hypothetical protein QGF56_07065 [Verrucomicrobiota bacterium]|nr:hypothetical protein [Verrucomicrobiota bacterium]MDP6753433.1 hypothetical protein [Verrucomicrobiota bacterium]MDP7012598.1 hypothetical protein [Verrucomicrobiota bacterium]